MINCLVVDDKPLSIDILTDYIEKLSFLKLVYATQSPLQGLEFINDNRVDLIFLDIQMPELNGMNFIKMLKREISVILTTAYSDYALEGYEQDVVDYLLKPVSFERFYKAAEKARKLIEINQLADDIAKKSQKVKEDDLNCLFVKADYKIQRIPFEEIVFIEARQNYSVIVTTKGSVMTLQHIKMMEEKLPSKKFIRVHKSFIISIEKIITIEKSRIQMDTFVIPIGESYRLSLFRKLGM
jgi:DNA-binding LytR/AlgR family response regulator